MPTNRKGTTSRSSKDDGLIKRPSTLMDRQTGGRYYHLRIDQLCKALRIDARKFHYIKGEVRKLVIQHMDVRLPYTQQPPDDIETVERKALEKVPLLKRYEGEWATTVFLKYILRVRSDLIAQFYRGRSLINAAAPRVQRVSEPPPYSARAGTLPTTLKEFLMSIKPNVFRFFLTLINAGLTDKDQFQKFLTLPLQSKTEFMRQLLEGAASEEELAAICDAIKGLGGNVN